MKVIDEYSYQLGAADCFCEIVSAGVKRLALSHPCDNQITRNAFLEDFEKLTQKYGISYYIEDSVLLSDLFPHSLNRNKYNVIFYKNPNDLEEYLALKKLSNQAKEDGTYEQKRYEIAYRFGQLLSYSDQAIKEKIDLNNERL